MKFISRNLICHHNIRNSIFGKVDEDAAYDLKTAISFMHLLQYNLTNDIRWSIKNRGVKELGF